jgi:hypothetical protein
MVIKKSPITFMIIALFLVLITMSNLDKVYANNYGNGLYVNNVEDPRFYSFKEFRALLPGERNKLLDVGITNIYVVIGGQTTTFGNAILLSDTELQTKFETATKSILPFEYKNLIDSGTEIEFKVLDIN